MKRRGAWPQDRQICCAAHRFWCLASGLLDTSVWWLTFAYGSPDDIDGQHRFEVVEKIADGRMGAVFRANQMGSEEFAKEVAIKVIERFAMQRQFIEIS